MQQYLKSFAPLLLLGTLLWVAAPTPAAAQNRGPRPDLAGGFTLARLKYTGGGDWYSDESSLRNLLRALKQRGSVRISHDKEAVVTATDPELWNFPMLFMTGHGNVKMNDDEIKALRAYLDQGGFLWADDNFGLDVSFRALMLRLYPDAPLTELPFTHPLFKQPYPFPGGPPKVHEHDGGPPHVFAVLRNGRIVVLYTFDTDIGNGIEDAGVHDDSPERREAALRFAVNIATYALTN